MADAAAIDAAVRARVIHVQTLYAAVPRVSSGVHSHGGCEHCDAVARQEVARSGLRAALASLQKAPESHVVSAYSAPDWRKSDAARAALALVHPEDRNLRLDARAVALAMPPRVVVRLDARYADDAAVRAAVVAAVSPHGVPPTQIWWGAASHGNEKPHPAGHAAARPTLRVPPAAATATEHRAPAASTLTTQEVLQGVIEMTAAIRRGPIFYAAEASALDDDDGDGAAVGGDGDGDELAAVTAGVKRMRCHGKD